MTLSRDCDGCPQRGADKIRFRGVRKGELVYCPSGEVHLVDE